MAEDRPTYTAEEVDRAVAALGDEPERFAHAQDIVTHAAPALQRVLNEALDASGYFGEEENAAIEQAARVDNVDKRLIAMRELVADETRVGMLVGVAAGFELAHELMRQREET